MLKFYVRSSQFHFWHDDGLGAREKASRKKWNLLYKIDSKCIYTFICDMYKLI